MKKILIIIFLLLMTKVSFARDITVEWDENEDADHYAVYWGTESGNYTNSFGAPYTDVDGCYYTGDLTALQYTITGLDDNTTYYIVVKAFNVYGNSSDFSNEVIALPSVRVLRCKFKATGRTNISTSGRTNIVE